jgi:opacity protein-like surface antigen
MSWEKAGMGHLSTMRLAASLLAVLSASAVSAADIPYKAPPQVGAPAPWINLFGGFAGTRHSYFGDAGAVIALNRNLQTDGWLLRLRGGAGHYEYNRTATLEQQVDFQVGEVMLGYHRLIGATRYSVYAGPNVEHHDNSDPLAVVKGTKWGAKVQGEIFHQFNPSWYGLLLGTYSTAFDSYFALAKLGYKITRTIAVGPEVASLGNDRFDHVHVGGFVAFDVFPATASQVIVSAGYTIDMRDEPFTNNNGAYGKIHLRTSF